MITIFLFGIVTVFFVFLILYLFSVVLKFFSGKERPAVVEEKKTRYSRENEEIIAVISAVLSQIIEGDYRIVSVKKAEKNEDTRHGEKLAGGGEDGQKVQSGSERKGVHCGSRGDRKR